MKCIVCGENFVIEAKNKYVVEKIEYSLIGSPLINYFECFDCPNCGCQNEVHKRTENSRYYEKSKKKDWSVKAWKHKTI